MFAIFLTGLHNDRVEFSVQTEDGFRPVTVLRHDRQLGASFRTFGFPHADSDAGRTLGSDDLDWAVKLRAWEEVTRLKAFLQHLPDRDAA